MRDRAAVGVDHDLPSRQAGVAHRAADDELARRVDVDETGLPQALLVVEVRGQDGAENVVDQVGLDLLLGVDPFAVLRRDEHALDLDRSLAAVLVDLVADRDLRLPVGAKVGEDAELADLGEPAARSCARA